MPTLRDIVRATLDARAPDARGAAQDLDDVLTRVQRRRARGTKIWVAAPAAFAAAALVMLLLRGQPRPEPQRGVHVYLRAADEPEMKALRLDLELKGER